MTTRRTKDFETLVSEYPVVSPDEARGILYATAKSLEKDSKKVGFLTQIGNEVVVCEDNGTLRLEARTRLFRNVVRDLLLSKIVEEDDVIAAQLCVVFLAQSSKHCPAEGRERNLVRSFLERCFKCHEDLEPQIENTGYSYQELVQALVNAKHFGFLLKECLPEAAVTIYDTIRAQMGEPTQEHFSPLHLDFIDWWHPSQRGRIKTNVLNDDLLRIQLLGGHCLRYPTANLYYDDAQAMLSLAGLFVRQHFTDVSELFRKL